MIWAATISKKKISYSNMETSPCGSRSSTTLGWEKSQTNPSLEQVRKVTDGNISSEGRKTLIQLPQ